MLESSSQWMGLTGTLATFRKLEKARIVRGEEVENVGPHRERMLNIAVIFEIS